MSDAEDDKVKRLPVRFKQPPGEEEPVLKVVSGGGACGHRYWPGTLRNVTYQIREGETEVECSCCGTRLDPMWVLKVLAGFDADFERRRKRAQEEIDRLAARSRTTCEHCKRMTRISKN